MRYRKYNTSSHAYTAIGQSTESSSITGNGSYFAVTIPSANLSSVGFGTGDRLYIDAFGHVSANNSSDTVTA